MTPQRPRGQRLTKSRPLGVALPWLLLCTLTLARPVQAADPTDGQFIIQSAYTEIDEEGVYRVTADIAYSLTEAAIEALTTSSVPLTFQLQIEVSRDRRFLPDDNVASLRFNYELSFHALTERYVVRNISSGELANYGTLAAALHGLGQIESLPVIDSSLLDMDRDYRLSMRSTLDLKSFPGPLRLLASLFRFNDWRLASKWHSWALNP